MNFGTFSRRSLLKMSGLAIMGTLLAACQPKIVEVTKIVEKEKVVEKVVKETVVVAGTPQVVQKEVTKIVEVQKTAPPKITLRWATPAELGLERTMYTNFTYMFTEEFPNIKIEPSFEAWGDYMTKLPTIVAAGTPPDVIHTHRTLGQEYAYRGVLVDHVPWAERDKYDLKEFIPELLKCWSHDGKVYSLPKDSAVQGVYYNKDMFDAYKVPYPKDNWNWEDFKQTCLLLTRDTKGRPANDPAFDASSIKHWGCVFLSLHIPADPTDAWIKSAVKDPTGSYYTQDQKKMLIDDPDMIRLFEMFADLRCKLRGMPSPAEAQGQGDQFRAGLCAMAFAHHSMTFFCKQERVRFKYDVTFTPAGPGGQFAGISASAFGVTKRAKYPEEGWQWVKFFCSERIQKIISEQKRWGVPRLSIINALEPTDNIPEHFSMVHTDPWKKDKPQKVKPWATIATPIESKLKQIMTTEFDALMTCGKNPQPAAEAAAKAKAQIEAELAQIKWP